MSESQPQEVEARALRAILRYTDGDRDYHHRIGEACGRDACVVCLIYETALKALAEATPGDN